MSTERFVDPEVAQALESVQEALRTERSALDSLPREQAELRERLEKLQGERARLLEELEGLKKGPRKVPRLPERLEAPFELRPWSSRWLVLREISPMLILSAVVLAVWQGRNLLLVGFVCFMMLAFMIKPVFDHVRKHPQWRFLESTIEENSPGVLPVIVPYAEVLDAEVRVSYSQHRRGVGSVVVRCKPKPGDKQEQSLTVKDVPEPERLAEWIRSKRGSG